jgi:hypothetical protein
MPGRRKIRLVRQEWPAVHEMPRRPALRRCGKGRSLRRMHGQELPGRVLHGRQLHPIQPAGNRLGLWHGRPGVRGLSGLHPMPVRHLPALRMPRRLLRFSRRLPEWDRFCAVRRLRRPVRTVLPVLLCQGPIAPALRVRLRERKRRLGRWALQPGLWLQLATLHRLSGRDGLQGDRLGKHHDPGRPMQGRSMFGMHRSERSVPGWQSRPRLRQERYVQSLLR